MGRTATIYMSSSTMPLPQTGLRLPWESWRWLINWSMMSWEMPSTFIIFVALPWTYSSMSLSVLLLGTALQMCLTTAVGERKNLPQSAGNASPNTAQDAVGLLCTRVHFWLLFLFLSNWTACIFCSKAAFQPVSPKPVLGDRVAPF